MLNRPLQAHIQQLVMRSILNIPTGGLSLFLLIPRTARNAINPEYLHWRVVLGKTYHLNISSVTTHCTLSFQIEGHNLTVVEVDGHYVEPFVNQSLIIYSGKTYSVKIKADQDPSRNYLITTDIVGQNATATTPLGLAVRSYSPPTGPIRNGVTPQSVQSLGNKACQGNICGRTNVLVREAVLIPCLKLNNLRLCFPRGYKSEDIYYLLSKSSLFFLNL
ncbi:L-ascorbate oxidase-like [Eucalyptus grandis]|uniref:L-ascorbate oxidase-like n=1 Tax=Eucalyptus grandis TaxID=71139 RepID=UPI0008A0AE6E|nr:L-ascorbate oxidase-like [Eucalyptus grandis]